jgi:hypothetical protein
LGIFKLLTHMDLDMSVFVYTKLDAITLYDKPSYPNFSLNLKRGDSHAIG